MDGIQPARPAGPSAVPEAAASTPSVRPAPVAIGPDLFINRELSWMEFNQRVIDESRDRSVPLVERLKFAGIAEANLDEFFMVRVAGLLGQRQEHIQETAAADRMSLRDMLAEISRRAGKMHDELYQAVREELLPELATHGVRLVAPRSLSMEARAWLRDYFRREVMPVLTPLAIDPGHPFPHVRNKSVNLIAVLTGSHRQDATPAFAVVQVPQVLSRLVAVPVQEEAGGRATYVLLDTLIAEHIGDLFPGFRCLGAWPFRVIRNFDLSVDEDEAEDLLEIIAEEVRRRHRGNAVRLTVDIEASPPAVEMLQRALGIDPAFVYRVPGPLSIPDLVGMAGPLRDEAALRDESFTPQVPPPFRDIDPEEMFEVIAKGDVLLHHPFESFDPVLAFVETAAVDPDVLAIKQTLYRTSGDSPVVKALLRAAELGKQVTALVEIKARFDEENNINFARKLEEAGVTVVYGLVGLKTHAKVALVVRREGSALRRYVHLGTGNYNPHTARLYTDLSFFTAKPEFGEDATSLFNLLTSCTAPSTWRTITVAPLGLHERVLGLIEREAANARAGMPSRIVAKMNSLVDPDVVQALYRASQAGVPIDLIVRGICVLRPGVPGVSESIRVTGVVDRFLEHHRIFYFEAGGAREVYAASADWMPRNFHRRVEVMFPIEDEALKARVWQILTICREDNVKARRMKADGTYERVRPAGDEPERRSQKRFLELAREIAERADARARRDRPFIVRPVRTRPTKEPEKLAAEASRESSPNIPRPPQPPSGGTPSGTPS